MRKDYLKKAIVRLHIVAGQIRGLEKMISGGKYCIDIINQLQAAKEALSSLENIVLEHHLQVHVAEQIKKGDKSKAIKEILSIYKASRSK